MKDRWEENTFPRLVESKSSPIFLNPFVCPVEPRVPSRDLGNALGIQWTWSGKPRIPKKGHPEVHSQPLKKNPKPTGAEVQAFLVNKGLNGVKHEGVLVDFNPKPKHDLKKIMRSSVYIFIYTYTCACVCVFDCNIVASYASSTVKQLRRRSRPKAPLCALAAAKAHHVHLDAVRL